MPPLMTNDSSLSFGPAAGKHPPLGFERLVARLGVAATDRVMVVGHSAIERVIALVASGCEHVMSLRASCGCPFGEAADVLWLVDTDDWHDRIIAAIRSDRAPRCVVVERSDGGSGPESVKTAARHLRRYGFVHAACHRLPTGIALVASRPTWLRRVH